MGSTRLSAQIFEQVQVISGLGDLKHNNGVAVADYDNDLDLDIFVVALNQDVDGEEATHSKLYRNNNDGSFTDVTDQVGLANLLPFDEDLDAFFGLKGFKHGVSWGDYNNDGYPDILFTNSERIQLFINQEGVFTEVTEGAGLTQSSECRHTGATWFDYNNDGFLDLYINDWDFCGTNSLYRNNGNGTFTNVTVSTNMLTTDTLASYTALPIDINEDGWMDLYVTNDFNDPNSLFINQNGTSFVEDAETYGLDNMFDDMGMAYADFNLDGAFDIFITAIDENALLQNNGANTFSFAGAANNLTGTGWAWGTRFADFDLDGDEDLIIANGFEFEERSTEQNVYYKNLIAEGGTGFEDVSGNVNFNALTVSVEAVDFDYDNDGDLDIYVTNANEQSILYENKLLNFDEESALLWLKIMLQGTVSNRDAIGTTLTLTTTSGTFKRYYTGVGFLSQSLQAVHFGLPQNTQLQELEIKWPSGLIETFQTIGVNRTFLAIEGESFTDLDILPSQKIYGCTDPFSCTYNPNATLDDGTCSYLTAHQISGNTTSGFFRVETYTYPITEGSTANWSVSGGEIIEGQGTDTISIKWGLNETGTLSLRENDGTCFSEEQQLEVSLNANNIPEDVSIARLWNEVLLHAIRNDFARPTVHARNLFHSSIAMYDIWAIYDDEARPYLIGNTVNNFTTELLEFIPLENDEDSRKKAISYAMYRLLSYRFQNSPNAEESQRLFDLIMEQLGYETEFAVTTLYQFGNAAALGNYVAQVLISYGNGDGSRELEAFENAYYTPVNEPLAPNIPTETLMFDPNRWQPLSLNTFIDQSGNLIPGSTVAFLSPEWGNVHAFAMTDDDRHTFQRDGNTYQVYNDPNDPPYLNLNTHDASSDAYKLGFSMVSIWGSHLDPNDGVLWDISPGAIGNTDISTFPTNYNDYPSFYNVIEGGDIGTGHAMNPVTGQAYESQFVPRGDYTRVLAEFWADGPDSETPPGHWFTILNYVNEHPDLEKRFEGEGDLLDDLQWDVKSYFILGGAMHDSAISAWSIKGWYDYVRPVSAIRNMALLGQSTDDTLDNYHVAGIPLLDGLIEVVGLSDPLRGDSGEHVGKIKLFTWKGPDYIDDETTDIAGVGWILAENWWPYQRPTFVTPPFAGYVSGHSTFSRAASEVLTKITGSPFFPGGMGEFVAKQNDFLVFEQGPSVDVKLQWATYRDASDQTSLSRIWGGIHPPADDIPGRLIGEKVGHDAFDFAVPYFSGNVSVPEQTEQIIYPNPVTNSEVYITNTSADDVISIFDIRGRQVNILSREFNAFGSITKLQIPEGTSAGLYFLNINNESKMLVIKD
ncbi:FG-GAP-like repeat-containing protein [Psychroserpens sp. SPM9]|uniref:FG-GAP-like repeat-containing protein n=1 Tax=Psychroserpens sp. SPM9 TaxID=2975598 RepID=UPI0021A4C254|nr:FG-GAP-like repeat-containing protein [Psychroserpens sp. SPM9]MDG5492540.1 FG-GAP-like repeat-containing protein [Psychroserpens sp. SPM9]